MDLGLQGKVALVTGAGSQKGFGKGIALALAKEGCDIIVVDKDLEGAEQTAAEVRALGHQAIAFKVDVTKSSEVNDAVKTALEKFDKIDILVNDAGACTPAKPFVEKTEAEWEPDIDINLKGGLICTKAVLPQMLERKSGKIINISSGVGVFGGVNSSIYSAAKAGVIAFTKSLAKEVIASGVYVNNIAPGIGDTNFHRSSNMPEGFMEFAVRTVPLRRATTPQDIGNAVVFLASDASSDIVGQTFSVDGGTLML